MQGNDKVCFYDLKINSAKINVVAAKTKKYRKRKVKIMRWNKTTPMSRSKKITYFLWGLGSCVFLTFLLFVAIIGNAVFNPTVTVVLRNASSQPLFNVRITVSGKNRAINDLPVAKDFSASFRSVRDSEILISFTGSKKRYLISYGYVTNGSHEKHIVVIPPTLDKVEIGITGNHFFPTYSIYKSHAPILNNINESQ